MTEDDMFPKTLFLKTVPPITPSVLLSVSHSSKQGLNQENSLFVLTTVERSTEVSDGSKNDRFAKPVYGAWKAYEDILMEADRVVQNLALRLDQDRRHSKQLTMVPDWWQGRVIGDKAKGQAIASEDVWDEKILEGERYTVIVRIHRVRVTGWA